MTDTVIATSGIWRAGRLLDRLRSGEAAIWLLLVVAVAIVLPPFWFLLRASFTVGTGAQAPIGLDNFVSVLAHSGSELWITSICYALGSSARGDRARCVVRPGWSHAPTRRSAAPPWSTAFLSLAVPVIIKSIGWIMLLGPNSGLVNVLLRSVFGGSEGPIQLYSLGGMIFVEGMLWMPIVFLLTVPVLSAMDPSLEEAAATSGADLQETLRRITLPLMRPSIVAVFLLALIRSLESFEVPLLIGAPGNLHTLTTAIYESMHSGFLPKYGEASAFAVLLLLIIVAGPLVYYYRTDPAGRSLRHHHRQGLPAAAAQSRRLALAARSVAAHHPAVARCPGSDHAVGVVPAGLQAAGTRRRRDLHARELSLGVGTQRHHGRHCPTAR